MSPSLRDRFKNVRFDGPVSIFDVSRQRVRTAAEVDLSAALPATRLTPRATSRMERAAFDQQLAADLGGIPDSAFKRWGISLGRRAAASASAAHHPALTGGGLIAADQRD